MTESSETDRDRAETEAATWRVLLTDDPDDRELASRFEAWRAASPLHAGLWERTDRAYALAGQRPETASVVVPLVRRRRRPVVVAAAVAIAACLILLAAPGLMLRLLADHLTETSEVRTLALEDGTGVRLGPESALGVDFSSGERRVRLLKGEAFFEVVPDAARPFRVAAGDVIATVLGTAFEVRLDGDDVGVAVQHGHVRVDGGTPPRAESLLAGDAVIVRPSGVERGKRNVDEIGDWIGGELVARNRPIMEVVDMLRRYYGGVIIVQDSTFARMRVTGIYDLRHPEATLTGLAASHDAAVSRLSPWLLVVTAK